MCGIAGLLASQQNSRSREILDLMLQSILHRGPDEDGTLVSGPLAMGMRRLSIIDLADGTQPMFRQSPPSKSRSISATLAPRPAAPAAVTNPAVPAPTTTRL